MPNADMQQSNSVSEIHGNKVIELLNVVNIRNIGYRSSIQQSRLRLNCVTPNSLRAIIEHASLVHLPCQYIRDYNIGGYRCTHSHPRHYQRRNIATDSNKTHSLPHYYFFIIESYIHLVCLTYYLNCIHTCFWMRFMNNLACVSPEPAFRTASCNTPSTMFSICNNIPPAHCKQGSMLVSTKPGERSITILL